MHRIKKIIKKIKIQRLLFSLCVTMATSYFSLFQEKSPEELKLGFPCRFYTIYARDNYPTCLNLGAFITNIAILYFICTVITIAYKKVKDKFRSTRK